MLRNQKRGILKRVQKCLWSSLMARLTTLSTRSGFLRASTALSSHSCGNMSIFAVIIQINKCLIFVAEKNVKTLNSFISTPADQPQDWNIIGLWSTVILKASSWYFLCVWSSKSWHFQAFFLLPHCVSYFKFWTTKLLHLFAHGSKLILQKILRPRLLVLVFSGLLAVPLLAFLWF